MIKNTFKSIGAVIAGFILIVVLSVTVDSILKVMDILPPDHLFVSTGLILFVLFYRAVFSLIGSYLSAKLAPQNPMKHALALGVLGLVISSIGAIVASDLGPGWYAWTLAAISLPVAWLGGRLFEMQSANAQRTSDQIIPNQR